jgi:hypothetical protein
MTEVERSLDLAIDALAAGEGIADEGPAELRELITVARRLQELPASQWPDPSFPDRLIADLGGRRPPAAHPRKRWRTRSGWRLGFTTAAAAMIIVAIGLVVSLNRAPTVSAAVLAGRAAGASSGHGLPPVSYTQVVTNRPVPGTFEPVPAPPRVVERVSFAAANRWRVQATVTEPYGEGIDTTLTVRNADTIVFLTTSRYTGTTETRIHAGFGAGLPTAATYGSRIDPLTFLGAARGRCGRRLSLGGDGPPIAGRNTLVLRLGPNPCPSADTPEINGPATFLIDAATYLVLDAKVFATDGHTLVQHLQTTRVAYRTPMAGSLFRLPPPLPTPRTSPFAPLPPNTSRSKLQARAAFAVLLPTRLPTGLHAQAFATIATQPTTGKLLGFTITYANATNQPALQLYEAPAASPSVRFPGRPVTIRAGVIGTYSGSGPPRFLWWIQNGTYYSLQEGGSSAGTPLVGRFSLPTLRALAASMA